MKFALPGLMPLLCLVQLSCFSQQVTSVNNNSSFVVDPPPARTLNGLSDHALQVLDNRYTFLNKLVERHTEKMLKRMETKELILQKKMAGKDSVKAAMLFSGTHAKYQELSAKLIGRSDLQANPLKEYLPGIDSMQTALQFLNQPALSGLGPTQLQKVGEVNIQLQKLQNRLQHANDIESYIRGREQQLKDQLSRYDLGKQLQGINSEVYYYQTQLSQYKNALNDPDKMQQAILSVVRQLPLFQRFFQQNSYFAQLFPVSPNAGTPLALAGLQTRDQVQQQLQQKFGISNPDLPKGGSAAPGGGASGGGGTYLQQQLQSAQTQLDAIKNKLTSSGAASSDMTIPDFQPNSQHTKQFLQRLEYGFNIQNGAATSLLPAISALGLNIGYKISDKATIGLGGSYLLGLGNGWNHIHLSSQGVGWRVYTDIRARGNLWITGGLEFNYMNRFSGIQDIRNLEVWQQSALMGLTKKYKIGRKTGNLQLLYDLLADREVPRGQLVKFRMGWGF